MHAENLHVETCKSLLHLTCVMSRQNCALICNNHNLQTLDVLGSLDDEYCTALDVKLPKLRILYILATTSYPANWKKCLLSVVRMAPTLQELQLVMDQAIDSQAWEAIGQHCSQLRELDMALALVSDSAMIEFMRLCPLIATLKISCNSALTDAGVLGMVRNLHALQVLKLDKCGHLTDLSVLHIARYCSGTLEELRVRCRYITEIAVKAMEEKCSRLRICEYKIM